MNVIRKRLIKAYLFSLERIYPKVKFPLEYSSDFNLFVAVFLSANSTDKQVNKVMSVLNKKLKDPEDYVKIPLQKLEHLIKSVGLYKQKAQRLHSIAKILIEKYEGKVPSSIEELQKLPGVGRKIANVVLQQLYDKNEGVVVDTHVKRLAFKLALTNHTNPIKIEADLMELLPKEEWKNFSLRLIYYGREYCPKRKHDHYNCPLTAELRKILRGMKIALFGFSFTSEKFGNKILTRLLSEGYNIFPVNLKGGAWKGIKVYKNLAELKSEIGEIDLVIFVVKPDVVEKVLKDLRDLSISSVWFQPGSTNKKVLKEIKRLGLEYFNLCFMEANGLETKI